LSRKSKQTFHIQERFSENRAVYEITWKNIVQPERSQMKMQYGAGALHPG